MAEFDYVIKGIDLSVDGIVDMDKLCSYIKSWFTRKNYDFYEKEYKDILKGSGKDFKIIWEGERKINDYVKFHIEITVKGKDTKKVHKRKCVACKGNISLNFKSFIQTDYEDKWKGNFLMKFRKEVWNKFIMKDKFVKLNEDLAEETHDIFNQTRAFLNINK